MRVQVRVSDRECAAREFQESAIRLHKSRSARSSSRGYAESKEAVRAATALPSVESGTWRRAASIRSHNR